MEYDIGGGSISIVSPTITTKPVPSELYLITHAGSTFPCTKDEALVILARYFAAGDPYDDDAVSRWVFVDGAWELHEVDE